MVGDEWGVITTTAIQEGYFNEQQNKILPENYVVSDIMKVCVDDINISQEKIKSIMIPLPPLAEQKRIVSRIEEILPYCEQLIK